jgi:hypothetical protein
LVDINNPFDQIKPIETISLSAQKLVAPIFISAYFGIIFGLIGGASGWLVNWLGESPYVGLFLILIVSAIGFVESLLIERRGSWSRRILWWFISLSVYTVVGTVFVVVSTEWWQGMFLGTAIGLLLGLISGLGFHLPDQLENKNTPNQGIHQSIRYFLIMGLVFGIVFGLLFWLLDGIIMGLLGGLLGGMSIGLLFGGFAFIQHFTLRFILWRTGKLPFRLVPFLDYCVDRIFLRKVGGGYIFIHRYLLEYFAALTEEDIERLSTEIEAEKA